MDEAVVVAFSLPGPTDEGMCPDFLAQALVDAHNDFVQRVDQALLLRGLDVQRHATQVTRAMRLLRHLLLLLPLLLLLCR